jgi:hypothetical protein
MTDSPCPDAGTASTSVTQWTRIDDVLVERGDLVKAISALRALPDSDTIIIKSLKDLASPVANTRYRLLADQYLRDHPEDPVTSRVRQLQQAVILVAGHGVTAVPNWVICWP